MAKCGELEIDFSMHKIRVPLPLNAKCVKYSDVVAPPCGEMAAHKFAHCESFEFNRWI